MRHTSAQMQELIRAWHQSGLSKKAYCRQQNLGYSTFHYWYKRLQSSPTDGFTELKVEASDKFSFQIEFTSGTRMMFEGKPCVSWLRELVS